MRYRVSIDNIIAVWQPSVSQKSCLGRITGGLKQPPPLRRTRVKGAITSYFKGYKNGWKWGAITSILKGIKNYYSKTHVDIYKKKTAFIPEQLSKALFGASNSKPRGALFFFFRYVGPRAYCTGFQK